MKYQDYPLYLNTFYWYQRRSIIFTFSMIVTNVVLFLDTSTTTNNPQATKGMPLAEITLSWGIWEKILFCREQPKMEDLWWKDFKQHFFWNSHKRWDWKSTNWRREKQHIWSDLVFAPRYHQQQKVRYLVPYITKTIFIDLIHWLFQLDTVPHCMMKWRGAPLSKFQRAQSTT